jgi:hypothetical protein
MLRCFSIAGLLGMVLLAFWAVPALAGIFAETAWVAEYDGPGDQWDQALAIAVDDSANVYVTGTSATIKYDADGNRLWFGSWGGARIAIDVSNSVYVTGGYQDYCTIRYYPDGDTAWVRVYDGANSTDAAWDVAADDSGNVYVTGLSVGSGTYSDYATVKYDSSGNELWVARYNGEGGRRDEAHAIALDGSGSIYVTGKSEQTDVYPYNYDYVTIKYDAGGKEVWRRTYHGPDNYGGDIANAIAVDGSGKVYVTGQDSKSDTYYDYATVKYDETGNELWVARYNGPGNGNDYGYDLTVDDFGNVYVTGTSDDYDTDYNRDYATIKYDRDGNELWVARYNGPGNGFDSAYRIAVDDSGNVYVTGASEGDRTEEDYATVRYDSSGNQIWVARYNGQGDGLDVGSDIALDNFGNVYVTGRGSISANDRYYATIKYVQTYYLCGDANGDGIVDIADVVYLIDYLFISGPVPEPSVAGDANCDGMVDVADIVYLINSLFLGGSELGF